MPKHFRTFLFILLLTAVAALIALPERLPIKLRVAGRQINFTLAAPELNFSWFGAPVTKKFQFKQGLDIQGGMQVVLAADMSSIPAERRTEALESTRSIIQRRVDLFGVNEPIVQTARMGENYRIIVELAGVNDPNQAIQLLGQTAQLDFRLQASASVEATQSAVAFFESFQATGLTGQQLKDAVVQFNQNTGEPEISLQFNDQGKDLFAEVTKNNIGKVLAIFVDGSPIVFPQIQTAILDGQASLTGGFTLEQARQLAIQLKAGALPVPISILEQKTIGASLGQDSVRASVKAGLVGIGLVMIFMIAYYGVKGVLAALALGIYALLTLAVYKVVGITLTLPGIAGLLLSIGMAVDSNILIFERLKEELRIGRPYEKAMELGFGRAWDSIKDANVATIMTALILINPLDLSFLNTSGLVRGFGITLLIGVLISLFTGVVVTRTLMRLFLQAPTQPQSGGSRV